MQGKDVFIEGKVKWAHTKRPNKYGDWSVDIYPNNTSLELVKQLVLDGIKNVLKKDDDGYYIRFKRPQTKIDKSGRMFNLAPVQVVDKDNRVFDDFIGNGSDCIIKLETYSGNSPMGAKYKAARLTGIKVMNHVPFTPASIEDEHVQKQVSGLEQKQSIGWP